MNSDRWQQVQEIFNRAVEHEPQRQPAFLEEACAGDAELRADIERLLHSDQRAGDFLAAPPVESQAIAAIDDAVSAMIGRRIGRYHIRGLIALGGMGAVYEAVQETPHRTVALKIMRQGIASRSAMRRFEYEGQIIGRLRHPGIVQIFEAGIHQGDDGLVPYFAMEYIPAAKNILEFAKTKELGLRERLELFAKVCDAVHHGHQRGVIHRDLKPANILVDSAGQPKVIDFGVARATDSDLAVTTVQTHIGQLVGTVQYMSPEQCDADPHDLDTRSDVYSLGVVLYELLTGEPPYVTSRSNLMQATRTVREAAPGRISVIDRKLRGDVETMVLKALEKDREKRYQSAADLSADLRSHLAREPISARPPTAWTLAVRWVTSHPILTTTATCVIIAGVVTAATYLSIWFLHQRPDRVVVSEDHQTAKLIAVSEKPIQSWHSQAEHGITFAELVERPAELGGGWLVLVGWSPSTDNRFAGELCAYASPDFDVEFPVWHHGIEEKHFPSRVRDREQSLRDFHPGRCWEFDIFPERPGKEVVVTFPYTFSQTAIRIYDLSGDLLYQVWHEGGVGKCHWLSEAGLIIFGGGNNDRDFKERGCPQASNALPTVVFALRPELGIIWNGLLGSMEEEPSLHLAWYKMLCPCNSSDLLSDDWSLCAPDSTKDPGRFVSIICWMKKIPNAGVSWIFDEFGNEEKGTRFPTDNYLDNAGNMKDLPDWHEFNLCELPPIVGE